MENSGTVAEYIDVSGYESTETRSDEKQPSEENASQAAESTSPVHESNMAGVGDESPVTGGHDF
jgi:hypothetical protein